MGVDGHGAVVASNQVVQQIEDLQLTVGEGPGLDAFELGVPVLEPYLEDAPGIWPFFRPRALSLGVASVFAFPLQVGVIRLGVLNLYRDSPGLLCMEELADALVLVDVATQGILDLQAQGPSYHLLLDNSGQRARVHEATGRLSVQIGSDMATALACIRSYAFAQDRSIFEIADDVVAGRLRLNRRQP